MLVPVHVHCCDDVTRLQVVAKWAGMIDVDHYTGGTAVLTMSLIKKVIRPPTVRWWWIVNATVTVLRLQSWPAPRMRGPLRYWCVLGAQVSPFTGFKLPYVFLHDCVTCLSDHFHHDALWNFLHLSADRDYPQLSKPWSSVSMGRVGHTARVAVSIK